MNRLICITCGEPFLGNPGDLYCCDLCREANE